MRNAVYFYFSLFTWNGYKLQTLGLRNILKIASFLHTLQSVVKKILPTLLVASLLQSQKIGPFEYNVFTGLLSGTFIDIIEMNIDTLMTNLSTCTRYYVWKIKIIFNATFLRQLVCFDYMYDTCPYIKYKPFAKPTRTKKYFKNNQASHDGTIFYIVSILPWNKESLRLGTTHTENVAATM